MLVVIVICLKLSVSGNPILNEATYMNLNATKRPFGRLDVSVGKQHKSGKIMFYAFSK